MLTSEDLKKIRDIFKEEVTIELDKRLQLFADQIREYRYASCRSGKWLRDHDVRLNKLESTSYIIRDK